MADNITLPGVGALVSTDEITRSATSQHAQLFKLMLGAESSYSGMLDYGQAAMSASLPVVIAINQSAIPTIASLPATPTHTRPSMAANATTLILASNASRKSGIIFNNTANTIWVKEGVVGVLNEGFPLFPNGYYSAISSAAIHGWNAGGIVILDTLEAT